MVIKKVPTLKEQVYEHLRHLILNHELKIGHFYSDQWVADRLGVSRSPVRDAVQQLKHEGLLEVIPYKGFKVKMLSEREIEEVFEVREAIEGFCLKKIINNRKSPQVKKLLQNLETIIHEQEENCKKSERNEFWEKDSLFHKSIVKFSNNTILINVYRSQGDKIKRIAIETLKDETRLETALEEHKQILSSLYGGTIIESYKINLKHLNSTKSLMLKALKNYNQQKGN